MQKRDMPCGAWGNSYHIAREQSERISHLLSKYIARRQPYIAEKVNMEETTIKDLAVELTVELTELCDSIRARSIFANQLLRSCSSIGANAYDAKYAQSRADFISKLEISLKECYETEYWLEILYKVHSLSQEQYKTVSGKCGTIRRKLITSITTAKKNAEY